MSEPVKPKRRVTAQISLASSNLPGTSQSPSAAGGNYASPSTRPVRARVDPTSVSGSSTPVARPGIRPSQSSANIRASASLPAVPTLPISRPRSPVKVKSPLLSPTAESGSQGGVTARVRVRAASPGGLSSPLQASYEANAGGNGGRVRARVAQMGSGQSGAAAASSNGGGDDGANQTRPRIQKAQTLPPVTPAPSSSRSRASSIVSGTSARVKAPPSESPVPTIDPIHFRQPPATQAGPSTPIGTTARHRSPSPGSRPRPPTPPRSASSDIWSHPRAPYNPLTPTMSNISANPSFAYINTDPTASAPPSPHHSALPPPAQAGRSAGGVRKMPEHPYSSRPAPPSLPPEPGRRLMDLPPLTPATTRDSDDAADFGRRASLESARRASTVSSRPSVDHGVGGMIGLGLEGGLDRRGSEGRSLGELGPGSALGDLVEERDGFVGSPEPDIPRQHGGIGRQDGDKSPGGGGDVPGDVEEARINRKVADLEISNASLLAINRTLEISKSKQRAEILRLRRALRESLAGPIVPLSLSNNASSSSSYFPQPGAPLSSPFSRMFSHTPGVDLGSEDEDELVSNLGAEAEMEGRWAKVEEMVGVMQKRAEGAVRAVAEDVKPSGRTVLGVWAVEEMDGDGVTGTGGMGMPERQGEG